MDDEPKELRKLDDVRREMGLPIPEAPSSWQRIKRFPGSPQSFFMLFGYAGWALIKAWV